MIRQLKLTSNYVVMSDGVRLRYLRTESSRKLNWLIFLHGAGGDATAWKKVQEACYHVGYPSIALDLRGHGLSDDPLDSGSYAFERMAKDVGEIIEKEKLTRPILIGHCFGGMAAQVFGAKNSKLISGIVLIDTSYRFGFLGLLGKMPGGLLTLIRKIADLFPPGTKQVRESYDEFVGTGDINFRRFISDVRATSIRSYLYCYCDVFSFDAGEMLEKIDVPTVVVCGEKDIIFPPKISEKLAKLIKKAELKILPGENHIIVINNPERLAEIIIQFADQFPMSKE